MAATAPPAEPEGVLVRSEDRAAAVEAAAWVAPGTPVAWVAMVEPVARASFTVPAALEALAVSVAEVGPPKAAASTWWAAH
jgi:hypothetical protein